MSEEEDENGGSYGLGWAFFKCCGNGPAPPTKTENLKEWTGGFCAALADYGEGEYDSVEDALERLGIKQPTLGKCLEAAQAFRDEPGPWRRWPSLPIHKPDNGILIA